MQFWSLTLVHNIERPERVQAGATKMTPALRKKRVLEEIESTPTLHPRKSNAQRKTQTVETFKTLQGFNNADYRIPFTLNENHTQPNGRFFFPKSVKHTDLWRVCNLQNLQCLEQTPPEEQFSAEQSTPPSVNLTEFFLTWNTFPPFLVSHIKHDGVIRQVRPVQGPKSGWERPYWTTASDTVRSATLFTS